MKRSELTGQIFGEFLVLGLSEISRNGHSRWFVRCSCGTEKTILGTHLTQGTTLNCGCQKRRPRNWGGYGKVPLTYYSSLVRGASGGKGRKPIVFNLTLQQVSELFDLQKGKCALTKLDISFSAKTASLDRINSELGYEEGNVQWLHKDINMMKRHYTEDYFKHLCRLVSDSCEIVDLT